MVNGICHYLRLRSSVGQTQFYRFTTMEVLKFTAEQAESFTFPVGCPVWYFPRLKESSRDSEGREQSIIFQGVVESVAMDLKTMQILYQVTKDGHDIGTGRIPETELAFAFQCPVLILPEEDETNQPMDGVVLQARKSNTGLDDGSVIYTVMHDVGGGYKAYKEGIQASRVKYRRVPKNNATPTMKGLPSSRAIDSTEEKVTAPQNASSNFSAHVHDQREPPLSAITFDTHTTSHDKQTYASRETLGGGVALNQSPEHGNKNVASAKLALGESASAKSTDGVKNPFLVTGKSTRGDNISTPGISINENAQEVASSSSYNSSKDGAKIAAWDASASQLISEKGKKGVTDEATSDVSASRPNKKQRKEVAVARKEDGEIEDVNYPEKKTRSPGEAIEIAVPLWLQRDKDCRDRLYSHLIGPKKQSHPGRILKATKCKVNILLDKTSEKPMTIRITYSQASGKSAEKHLISATRTIEDLLLKFKMPNLPAIEDDGSKGRLLYEVANSYKGGHAPKGSKYGVVTQRNPIIAHPKHCCMSVVELPRTSSVKGYSFHGHFLLDEHVAKKINKETGCSIVVCGDEFALPVKYCDPYVLVCGSSSKWWDVDRAVELVEDEIRRHQCHCACFLLK